jgi:hypothetical protein
MVIFNFADPSPSPHTTMHLSLSYLPPNFLMFALIIFFFFSLDLSMVIVDVED